MHAVFGCLIFLVAEYWVIMDQTEGIVLWPHSFTQQWVFHINYLDIVCVFCREEKGIPVDGGATTSSGYATQHSTAGTAVASANSTNPLNGQPYSQRYQALYKKRILLPVFEYRADFMRLLAENQCIVLVGEVMCRAHCTHTFSHTPMKLTNFSTFPVFFFFLSPHIWLVGTDRVRQDNPNTTMVRWICPFDRQ